MAEVRFDHVFKKYGELTVINDLTLTVIDKEFLVLVGPSGSGKSTVLRLLSGLEPISGGDIYIGEQLVNTVAPKDRDIAMVFQSYALYPHMTVADNMGFGLSLRKTPKPEIKRRVQEAARILGIEELLQRKPRQLSGGQRQRVALGRAIVREPAAFLLDEPLSNLDAKLRVQTRAELSKLHRRLQTTFIYVTHDQVEAMTMASRIAVLDRGILQQVGAPKELYDQPANIFVAGFIGSPAMNFFRVRIEARPEGLFLLGGVKIPIPKEKESVLLRYKDQDITLGIRPEDIHAADFQPPGIIGSPVKAQVDVTELLGSELFLHLVADGEHFQARVDVRTSATPGKDIDLVFNMANMHAFNLDNGVAIPV